MSEEHDSSRLESMWNSFQDLPFSQKLGALAASAVGVFLVITLLVSFFPGTQPAEEEIVDDPSSAYTEDPIQPGEVDSSATPVPTDDVVPIDEEPLPIVDNEELPPIPAGVEMPVVDQRAALDTAEKAIDSFIDWAPTETMKKRQSRIDAYFTKDSSARTKDPLLETEASAIVDDESGKPTFGYMGEVTSTTPVGGDEKRYRAIIGVELRSQMFDPATGEKGSAVNEYLQSYTVDMTKSSGAWKIISIVVE